MYRDKIIFDDGDVVSFQYSAWHKWETIEKVVADLLGCDPEDVSAEESDDGDFIAVRGKRVGKLASDMALVEAAS